MSGMEVDLVGYSSREEHAAIQAAASAGLKSMEHLISQISYSSHSSHSSGHLSSHHGQSSSQVDCKEITDFTVSKFKKVISILDRTGHARFRRGPSRSSSGSQLTAASQAGGPPPADTAVTLDFTKPRGGGCGPFAPPPPPPLGFPCKELEGSLVSKNLSRSCATNSSSLTAEGSVSNGRLFLSGSTSGAADGSRGPSGSKPPPQQGSSIFLSGPADGGSVSNGNKLSGSSLFLCSSSAAEGNGSVSNGSVQGSSIFLSVAADGGSVSNGKLFLPGGTATEGAGGVSDGKQQQLMLLGSPIFFPANNEGSVSNGGGNNNRSSNQLLLQAGSSSGAISFPGNPNLAVPSRSLQHQQQQGSLSGGKPPLSSCSLLKKKCPGHDGCDASGSGGKYGVSSSSRCHCKKRRCRVKRKIRVPAISNKIADIPADEYSWRKYGQKPIKGSPYPRGYYKCSSLRGCPARKHVERDPGEPSMLIVTYEGEHCHLPNAAAPPPPSSPPLKMELDLMLPAAHL